MKIYIDSACRCHTDNPDGTYREFDVPYFEDKCTALIEGYRYVPPGETWIREDGEVFTGEMIAPWKAYAELDAAQREYERMLFQQMKEENADMKAALDILGVTADG